MNLRKSTMTEGVSPVIGVILMVVITVVLGAIVANYMLDFGDQADQQNPSASMSFDQNFDPNANDTDNDSALNGYTVEVQLTRAAAIDYVEVELGSGVSVGNTTLTSTDDQNHNGGSTNDAMSSPSADDMDEVGEVITASGLDAGDKLTVIGSLDGRDQVLNRYQVRQR